MWAPLLQVVMLRTYLSMTFTTEEGVNSPTFDLRRLSGGTICSIK